MNKTDELNVLFSEWKKERPEESERMHPDGIICEETYNKTKPKILFIMKEPNNPEWETWDVREYWAKGEIDYLFSWRLSRWANGILNGFPSLPVSDDECRKSIQSIAFMNLKKTGGGRSSDYDEILKATEDNQKFLQRQVSIISPDVIVGGIGFDGRLWSLLFPDISFQQSGIFPPWDKDYDMRIALHEGIQVIDFYHPSYTRHSEEDFYCLLDRTYKAVTAINENT